MQRKTGELLHDYLIIQTCGGKVLTALVSKLSANSTSRPHFQSKHLPLVRPTKIGKIFTNTLELITGNTVSTLVANSKKFLILNKLIPREESAKFAFLFTSSSSLILFLAHIVNKLLKVLN